MGSRQSKNNITRFKVSYNVNEIPPSASAASAKKLIPDFGNSHNEDHFSVAPTLFSANGKCVFTEQRLQSHRKLLAFC